MCVNRLERSPEQGGRVETVVLGDLPDLAGRQLAIAAKEPVRQRGIDVEHLCQRNAILSTLCEYETQQLRLTRGRGWKLDTLPPPPRQSRTWPAAPRNASSFQRRTLIRT